MIPTIEEKNACLKRYEEALQLKNAKLPELDHWYRIELRKEVLKRSKPYLTQSELVKLMEWKTTRGKFRPMLKGLILKNSDEEVRKWTTKGFQSLFLLKDDEKIQDPQNFRSIMDCFCTLKGVGPATASAILALVKPNVFPFMSDEALYFTSSGILKSDKPKYNFTEYLELLKQIQNQINTGPPSQDCLENMEEFEKSVWAYGILKSNQKLDVEGVQKKRNSSESSPKKNVKRRKKA